MKVVIAPDSFKEALAAREVCAAIARGLNRARPGLEIDCIPIADGGEGTVDALIGATGGTFRETNVTGPLRQAVCARWGILGDGSGTAVIEMAAASGLHLVPPAQRNPLRTTTYGTGELIRAALDAGCTRILAGIGGSATNDGGTGAAQAVGLQFLDAAGQALPPGLAGGDLADIAKIDAAARDVRLDRVKIDVACDVDNPLCGERGAAAIYGPQKGATPEQVQLLDRNLAHLAGLIGRDCGRDIREVPGAGAAGGLGAGLVAFFGAELRRGIQLIMEAVRFADRMREADLVITGEGRLDAQSLMGKVIAGIAGCAKSAGVRVVALVGSAGEGAEASRQILDDYHVITPAGMPLDEALSRTAELLETSAARVLG